MHAVWLKCPRVFAKQTNTCALRARQSRARVCTVFPPGLPRVASIMGQRRDMRAKLRYDKACVCVCVCRQFADDSRWCEMFYFLRVSCCVSSTTIIPVRYLRLLLVIGYRLAACSSRCLQRWGRESDAIIILQTHTRLQQNARARALVLCRLDWLLRHMARRCSAHYHI